MSSTDPGRETQTQLTNIEANSSEELGNTHGRDEELVQPVVPSSGDITSAITFSSTRLTELDANIRPRRVGISILRKR